jgi:hypothetical protein
VVIDILIRPLPDVAYHVHRTVGTIGYKKSQVLGFWVNFTPLKSNGLTARGASPDSGA